MKELLNFVLKYKVFNLKTTSYIRMDLKINISHQSWNNFHRLQPTINHIE